MKPYNEMTTLELLHAYSNVEFELARLERMGKTFTAHYSDTCKEATAIRNEAVRRDEEKLKEES